MHALKTIQNIIEIDILNNKYGVTGEMFPVILENVGSVDPGTLLFKKCTD